MICNLKQKFKTCVESKKNNKGFTLVELIVVIVILAILIGVTIGGVFGYVNKSRINTDINNAAAIQSALSTLAVDSEVAKHKNLNASIEWNSAKKANTTEIVITDDFDKSSTDTEYLANKIITMLPDGLPAPKAGGSFKIFITTDAEGNAKVSCKTSKESSFDENKPLQAQE